MPTVSQPWFFEAPEAYNALVPKASLQAGARSSRRGSRIISLLGFLALIGLIGSIGLLPVLPALLHGGPVLNNDMLVAYFCYFWDFHRNWSWSHPLVFWSSSYQCGMPMHGYWQSGYLYPVTWLLFGPISPHVGIYLFYAFHFSLGVYGFLRLGPRLGLHRTASLWAGICFALSGTMLARYEHATFLAGWAWIPLVLHAFLALRDAPGPKAFFIYAGCVALQALGGHPQASAATAILIAVFTVTAMLRRPVLDPRSGPPGNVVPGGSVPRARARRAAWILGGHLLALIYCAPMLIPFVHLVDQTDRFDGTAWEGGNPGETAAAARGETGGRGFRLREVRHRRHAAHPSGFARGAPCPGQPVQRLLVGRRSLGRSVRLPGRVGAFLLPVRLAAPRRFRSPVDPYPGSGGIVAFLRRASGRQPDPVPYSRAQQLPQAGALPYPVRLRHGRPLRARPPALAGPSPRQKRKPGCRCPHRRRFRFSRLCFAWLRVVHLRPGRGIGFPALPAGPDAFPAGAIPGGGPAFQASRPLQGLCAQDRRFAGTERGGLPVPGPVRGGDPVSWEMERQAESHPSAGRRIPLAPIRGHPVVRRSGGGSAPPPLGSLLPVSGRVLPHASRLRPRAR